jgi:hypothetical protein
MTDDPYDPSRVLRTLNAHQVRYVVIGGLASQILGAPVVTHDTDICYERSAANMERLASALQELGAELRDARVDEELPSVLDGRTIAAGDSFTFRTGAGAVDILATPSGTGGFRDLTERASDYELDDGLVVRVVDLEDLIRMKEAAGRIKDRLHLEQLAAMRRLIQEAEQPPPT